MNKRHQNTIFLIRVHKIYFALFFLIISIIFFINFLDFKEKINSSFITATSEKVHTNIILRLMATEIGSLRSLINEQETPSISRIVFLTFTNIWPEVTRTFLGREIPGFSNFNTEIAIAGIGTDLTTMPMESAPPLEVLLKEKEMAEQELGEKNVSKEKRISPILKTGKDVAYIYIPTAGKLFCPRCLGRRPQMKL